MVRIDPDTMYSRLELVERLGTTIVRLATRVGGLRAVGDWYLGKSVLESVGRVHDVRSRRGVSGKEVNGKNGIENQVEKVARRGEFQSPSVGGGRNALVGQVAQIER